MHNIYCDDALTKLETLQGDSIDALVCDPPAGISFMGKSWDGDKGGREQWIAWMGTVMRQCLRVLKPGAHGLVWSLPRTSHWTGAACEQAGFEIRDCVTHLFGTGFPKSLNLGDGWGTALKPAAEFWWLIRKPISEKTVAANVARWGTGGINIDGCRIGTELRDKRGNRNSSTNSMLGTNSGMAMGHTNHGRFPANLVLDEEAAAMLGGASRFFYVAKASQAERNAGLEGMPKKDPPGSKRTEPAPGRSSALGAPRENHHPTVKALKLMSYLCRLVTPPGGTVLDPFMGSGSTGIAAKAEGFRFIGIEREQEYFEIAERRLASISY